MSKMADMSLDIQQMLADGFHPTTIAKTLEVPLGWVYDTLESMDEENNIEELTLQTDNLESSNININNKEFYKVYELINNKIKEDIINNLRNIFINKKIKNNIDLSEMIEDEEDN
jgi:hypothetical protein